MHVIEWSGPGGPNFFNKNVGLKIIYGPPEKFDPLIFVVALVAMKSYAYGSLGSPHLPQFLFSPLYIRLRTRLTVYMRRQLQAYHHVIINIRTT